MARWGLSWKVPFSYLRHQSAHEGGTQEEVPYLSPVDFFQFLLGKAPELLMGGAESIHQGECQLHSFWECYRKSHGEHEIFSQCSASELKNVVPVALHGDEGRGLRRGNTCVMSAEAVIGVDSHSNAVLRRPRGHCDQCYVNEPAAKRFRTNAGAATASKFIPLWSYQVSNLKHHPYLSKFMLAVLPHKVYKTSEFLDELVRRISEDMNKLFHNGLEMHGKKWRFAVIGWKGDLDWFRKIAGLTRCYKKVLKQGEHCCHECAAGCEQYPFEETGYCPQWAETIFFDRPWQSSPPISQIPFQANVPEKILRRDPFHIAKLGVFRDLIGSAVVTMARLQYFHQHGPEDKNDIHTVLNRAYSHFAFFCKTTGHTPSLHSFSVYFFNAPNRKSFAWVNAKGSDAMILLKWLAVFSASLAKNPLAESHMPILSQIHKTVGLALEWQNCMYAHGLWMSRHCAASFCQSLQAFLSAYNRLAYMCLHDLKQAGFALKPKLHLLSHMCVEMATLLEKGIDPVLSPLCWNCESNEDVIGKASRLSRRVSARQTSKRSLQMYLIKSKALYRKFRANKFGNKG